MRDELLGELDGHVVLDVVGDLHAVPALRVHDGLGDAGSRGSVGRGTPRRDEVGEDVAVHVLDHVARLPRLDEGHLVVVLQRGGRHLVHPREQRRALGAGQRGVDLGPQLTHGHRFLLSRRCAKPPRAASEVAQGFAGAVASVGAADAAPRVRARPAEVEPRDRRPVVGVAPHRPVHEQLVRSHLAVQRMAAGEAEHPLEIQGREDLSMEDRRRTAPGSSRRARSARDRRSLP